MPETIAAPAPAAASSPAPTAPVSAPSSAPASTPAPQAPATTSTPTFGGNSGVTSSVDPNQYPIKEDYAKALLAEKMAAIPAVEDAPAPTEEVAPAEAVADPAAVPEVTPEVPAPDAEVKPAEPVAEEPDFELEPAPIVTPEALTQMVTDNPEFGKLLEADPKLKGQLYKTAREAAELKPYREIFPDLDSAKSAVAAATEYGGVKEIFMNSTTKEGTMATLGKIAELSYERDADGNVVMENGQPKIGEDFFQFVDHTVALDLEHRAQEVEARLKANRYHVGVETQEQADAAYEKDHQLKAALDILRQNSEAAAPATEELPASLREKAAELDRREKALTERQQGERVEERTKFESNLQTEAQTRISDGIAKIIANVEKQGGVVSPYLKNILPKAIGAKLIQKIQANPALQDQMHQLQRLPIGDASRTRRLAAIDRAVQQYLPDVAREELREAGVQVKANAEAKAAKVGAQAKATQQTEIRGGTGVVAGGNQPMTSSAAFDHAQAEWTKANPGKPFDKVAKEMILPRVLQLMTTR